MPERETYREQEEINDLVNSLINLLKKEGKLMVIYEKICWPS